jgi:hypothetical protein
MKDYLVELGVDANLMLQVMATPDKDMYWLTRDELLASHLAKGKRGEELVKGTESDPDEAGSSNLARWPRSSNRRWWALVDFGKDSVEAPQAAKAGSEGNLGYWKVGRIQEALRSLNTRSSRDLRGAGPEMSREQPRQVP